MFVYQSWVMGLWLGLLILVCDLLRNLYDVSVTLLTWEHVGSLPSIDFLMVSAIIIGKLLTACTSTIVVDSVSTILTLRRHNMLLLILLQVHNLLSETLGTRHISEIGIFRIS
jgi:hypothetical protein